MQLLNYTSIWNPCNPDYYYAAIEIICLLIPALLPNIYFFKLAIYQKLFKNRPILRYTIIIQTTQYIFSTIFTLSITLLYFYSAVNGNEIHMVSCSLLRALQQLFIFSLSSTPFIIAIIRNFSVTKRKHLNILVIFALAIILNTPTLIVLYEFFFSKTMIIDHEICGKIIEVENMTLVLVNILCIAAYPFLGFVTNILTYFSLKKQYSRMLRNSRFKQEKDVILNLSIQSIIPLVSQAPMLILLLLSYINRWQYEYYLWRITDFIYYTHFIYVIFLSTIFIEEIRSHIIPQFKRNDTHVYSSVLKMNDHT
uniref:G_PROTEIN_RECEP_F1_2 domain-containing protein n=1 Tax=Parastrongyloides trichosuri TaxID=131310 RepID=A0A0N4ZTL9_PARTI